MTRVALKAFSYSNPHDSWAVRRALQHVELNADEEFNSNEKCCFRCIRFRVENVFWDLQDFSIKKRRICCLLSCGLSKQINKEIDREKERQPQPKTKQFNSLRHIPQSSSRDHVDVSLNVTWTTCERRSFVRSACQAFNAEGVGFWLISLLINAFVAFLIPPYRSATTNRGF